MTRVLRALVGVLLLVVVAVAGAGLILALDHPPDEQGRPELTARGHQLVAPRLGAMDVDLAGLTSAADTVADAGRRTLTRLRALDVDGVDAATLDGDTAAIDAVRLRESLLASRATLLDGTALDRLPISDRLRIGALDAALQGTGGLVDDWTAVRTTASDPTDLVRALQGHDANVVAATASGRAGRWAAALRQLADARRQLAVAQAIAATADEAGAEVTTLTDLLDRLDAYDAALVTLYTRLQASGGTVDDPVREAYAAVERTQGELPETNDALVISVSDLAAAAITRSLLDIETARGQLHAALDAAAPATSPPVVPADPSPAAPTTSPSVAS
ncbi:MAG: hypothetical protein KF809_16725 [Chloroflexi bacterium]|nr:hypothetical protein [Chloroflexota bacterium]